MPDRAEYQPLAQDVDDDRDEGVAEVLPSPVTASRHGLRRPHRPGNIDLSKLDNAFKRCENSLFCLLDVTANDASRWTESIAQKVKRKKKVEDNSRKEIWHSVFAPQIDPVPTDDIQVSLKPALAHVCGAHACTVPLRLRHWTTSRL